jgi:hypothetical protein
VRSFGPLGGGAEQDARDANCHAKRHVWRRDTLCIANAAADDSDPADRSAHHDSSSGERHGPYRNRFHPDGYPIGRA